MTPTLEQFATATGADLAHATVYFDQAVAAMDRFQITDPEAVAAFCATIGVETQYLTAMEESLYYKDPARIADLYKRVFDKDHNGQISAAEIEAAKPYARNSNAVSKLLYNGFHGRGGAMLTWQGNYKKHGDLLGFDYVSNPALVKEPMHAMLTAGSFWDVAKCNECASDMGEVTLRWNGPRRLALDRRIALRDIGLAAL